MDLIFKGPGGGKSGGKKSSDNMTYYGVPLADVMSTCQQAMEKRYPGSRNRPLKIR